MLKARAALIVLAASLALATFAPAAHAASISLTAKPSDGVWGTQFELRGFTEGAMTIHLQRRLFGTSSFSDIGSDQTTDSGGFFRFFDTPSSSADYRVRNTSDGSTSGAVHVLVRVGVSIALGDSGNNAVFSGRVLPVHPGTHVTLQMFDGNNKVWRNVKNGTLSSSSRYSIAYRAPGTGRRLFRTAWPTQDSNHLWNTSAWVWVTWS